MKIDDTIAEAVLAYSKSGSSMLEVCELLTMSQEQFKLYEEVYELGFNQFKHQIRKAQLAFASESAVMAIWLGKQHLNQRDFKDDGTETTRVIDETVAQALQELLKDYELTPIKRRPTNVRKIK